MIYLTMFDFIQIFAPKKIAIRAVCQRCAETKISFVVEATNSSIVLTVAGGPDGRGTWRFICNLPVYSMGRSAK